MLDGNLLVDAHVHVAKLPTLSADWQAWVTGPSGAASRSTSSMTLDGTCRPRGHRRALRRRGRRSRAAVHRVQPQVDRHPADRGRPAAGRAQPGRFRPVANINPHLHYPVAAELARQVALGAVACKIHPVHGGFEPADRMLYPAYSWAAGTRLPVIVHCGTSTFSGSANAYGEPALLDPVFRDFPGLTVVLAHGGRGWWYDQAAFLTLMRPNVWLEVSGLPPHRLADYYGQSLRAARPPR